MTSELYIRIKNLNETKILAQKFSKLLSIPFFICLFGDIGSGKTTFARFLINEFSKKKIKVLSPTFPIVQIYELKTINIWHYDLYRIEKKNEFFNLDFDTAFGNCVIVEWPDIFLDYFPKNRIEINFKDEKNNTRDVSIKLHGTSQTIREKLWKKLDQK
jgi:tRNA threonylcarbamoyladenosine biosynthesis protein TsaE